MKLLSPIEDIEDHGISHYDAPCVAVHTVTVTLEDGTEIFGAMQRINDEWLKETFED